MPRGSAEAKALLKINRELIAALGLVISPRRRDVQQTVMVRGDHPPVDAIVAAVPHGIDVYIPNRSFHAVG